MSTIRLTRRGKRAAVGLTFILTVGALHMATRDLCWTGTGYGSCTQMFQQHLHYNQKETQ